MGAFLASMLPGLITTVGPMLLSSIFGGEKKPHEDVGNTPQAVLAGLGGGRTPQLPPISAPPRFGGFGGGGMSQSAPPFGFGGYPQQSLPSQGGFGNGPMPQGPYFPRRSGMELE